MADTLAFISKIGFAACIGFAVLAVVLFVVFKIPDVIGELSGRKSKRSIQKQRDANVKKGNQSYRSNRTNAKRVKLTDKIQMDGSAPPKKETKGRAQPRKETEYVGTGVMPGGEAAYADETMPLDEKPYGDETVSLNESSSCDGAMPQGDRTFGGKTMQPYGKSVAPRMDGMKQRGDLSTGGSQEDGMPPGAVKIDLIEEVMLIHSEEVVT